MNPAKILIVEDDETTRLIGARTLEEQGYEVQQAADGISGLYLAHQWNPDLVVLDLGLPDMSGVELARVFTDHPFIVLTGDQDQEQFEACKTHGALNYVIKPPTPETLCRQVAIAIERGRESISNRRATAETRRVAQAIGILMERNKIDEHEAFNVLCQQASKSQSKVTVLAHDLVQETNSRVARRGPSRQTA